MGNNQSNRIVKAQCTLNNGITIEVGKLCDSNKAYITSYDVSHTPLLHATFENIYTFNAITACTDIRAKGGIELGDEFDDFSIFVAGCVYDGEAIRPLILCLDPVTFELNTDYTSSDQGYFNDVIVDVYPNSDDCSVYACGAVIDRNCQSKCLITKLPLADDLTSPLHHCQTQTDYYEYKCPASFKRIAIGPQGGVRCSGFVNDNHSETDFDFLVIYNVENDFEPGELSFSIIDEIEV
jgi:hypothetical protein